MKIHSGWLAAGLLLAAVLACNTTRNGNNSNSNNSNNSNSNKSSNSSSNKRPANADVYIQTINMAKDKDGAPGDTATSFEPGDRPHCVIHLNKAKAGTEVKFVWWAVDVPGSDNGELTTVDYTTKSFENVVHAHLTRSSDWPKGSYKVEVHINGALDKSIDYTVE